MKKLINTSAIANDLKGGLGLLLGAAPLAGPGSAHRGGNAES